jgi:protein involved in sex pheromone biosynthesis
MTTRLMVASLVLMGSLLVLAGCGGIMGSDKEMMKKDEMKKEEMKKDRMMKEEMMRKGG